MEIHSRKEFLIKAIRNGSSFLVLGIIGWNFPIDSQEKRKNKLKSNSEKQVSENAQSTFPVPDGEVAVSEDEPMAKALGFHHDAKQTDFSLFPSRKSPSAKTQFCATCSQYSPLNDGWGRCNVITKGLVSQRGWCSAWSPANP